MLDFVSNTLVALRGFRDNEQDKEVRHAFNEACDRLDVLESKIMSRYWPLLLKKGDVLIAVTDVPCPVQPGEVQFVKDERYTICNCDKATVTLQYGKYKTCFARRTSGKLDFVGDWFRK